MKTTDIRPDLNRPETRKKYFANHLWCEAIFIKGNYNNPTGQIDEIDADFLKYFAAPQHNNPLKTAVLLTSLANITDEHLIQIGVLFDWFPVDDHGNHVVQDLNDLKKHLLNQALDCDYYGINISSDVVDFIRANGYAWRWNGYTVDELIAAGYCQLRKGGE